MPLPPPLTASAHPAPLSPSERAAPAAPGPGHTHPPASLFPSPAPALPPSLFARSSLAPSPAPAPASRGAWPRAPPPVRGSPGRGSGFMVTRRRPLQPSGGGGSGGAGRLSQSAGPGGGRAQAAAASAPTARGPALPPRRAPVRLACGGPGGRAAAAPRTHGRPGHHHPGDQP